MGNEPEVFGRASELASVADFLESVSAGSAALLIEGDAGIGKTTIWNEALRMAAEGGFRVLSCRPSEPEARLSFAALSDLLRESVEETLPTLPAPQRMALQVAMLLVPPDGPPLDQRTVSTATLAVIRHLAESAPLAIAVEDIQWMDRPSARVLEFIIRRLTLERVAFLASRRTGMTGASPLGIDVAIPRDRLRRIAVGPLDKRSLGQIVRSHLGANLPPPSMHELTRISGGNPLFALEIGRAFLRDRRVRRAGESLPVPADLAELVTGRLRTLPRAARAAVQAASGPWRSTHPHRYAGAPAFLAGAQCLGDVLDHGSLTSRASWPGDPAS